MLQLKVILMKMSLKLIKVKPKPFIASWKDIDPGKKLNLRLKRYQMA